METTVKLAIKNRKLYTAMVKGFDGLIAHEEKSKGKYAAQANKVSEFCRAEYGEDVAPWALVSPEALPDAVRAEYLRFIEALKTQGHSNPFGMWGRVRDLGAEEMQAKGWWPKFAERLAERAERNAKRLEANRAAKKKAPAAAPAAAPAVQAAPEAPAEAPFETVLAKLSPQEQALAAFERGVRLGVQAVSDCPDIAPEIVAVAKAVAVAFSAVAPQWAALEKKINRLRTAQ